MPRSSLADWVPPSERRDPVEQLRAAHEGRIDWLVPVRVGRMVASPYGFLRGSASVMAEDVAALPSTGITPVICGDAHIGNVALYASPEREPVLDLNDLDEAHPGGWEWDLRRLVASTWVLGRQNGASEGDCEEAAMACVGSVGLRAYIALLEGSSSEDVVFLQLKQARRSVIARFVHGDSAWHDHQGMRVVAYQQALQTVSDPLLGWASTGDRQYYVRQFRNMKGTIPLDSIGAAALSDHAGICGRLLAKGHARTSGSSTP